MTYAWNEPITVFAGVCLAIAIVLFLIAVVLSESENP